MDFELTEEQAALREVSRQMLQRHAPLELTRAMIESDAAPSDTLWTQAADLGWPSLAVPEAYGGAGQGIVELAIVAEEIGHAAASGPFDPSGLAAMLLGRFGSEALAGRVLADLAAGTRVAVAAAAEPGTDLAPPTTAVSSGPSGPVLGGAKTMVQDAGAADHLLVTALVGGRPGLVLVDRDADGVTVAVQHTLDLTRSFCSVLFEDVAVEPDAIIDAPEACRLLEDAGAVLTAADALGAGSTLLEMTSEYVAVREQFNRPIGSFQAIKHKLSDMLIAVRGARAATYYAAMAIDADGDDATRASTVAKAFTTRTMSALAGEALQTHGGIGFTWEHDLHLFLRRIKTDETLFGTPAAHHDRLIRLLTEVG